MKFGKLILPLTALSVVISGCSTTRQCPAFFQPDYNKWAQQRVGEMLVFVDQNGVTETFEVTKIEPNGPFQTEGRGSRERNVLCDLTVREVLVGAESKTIFIKRFNHGEFSDRELSGEPFWPTIDVVTEAKYFRPSDFSINLKRHDGFYENDFSREINFAELEIGGSLYQDVITAEVS